MLEVKLRVKNRTSKRKRVLGCMLTLDAGGGLVDEAMRRKAESRKSRLPMFDRISVIEPHDEVSGWLVDALPYRGRKPPGYSISVRDELGNDYEARRR